LEKQTRILQELAANYPDGSQQYSALENAAFALTFSISEQYESFTKFIETSKEDLSDEQKESLRNLGLAV